MALVLVLVDNDVPEATVGRVVQGVKRVLLEQRKGGGAFSV